MAPGLALAVDIPAMSTRELKIVVPGNIDRSMDALGLSNGKHSDGEEFDFSEVFGPSSFPQLAVVCEEGEDFGQWAPPEIHYEGGTPTIYSRSHSLVGPSPSPSLTKQPNKYAHELGSACREMGSRSCKYGSAKVHPEMVDGLVAATGDHNDSNNELDVFQMSGASSSDDEESSTGDLKNKLGPHDFELLQVVGKGAFGKVFQVRKKDTDEIFAMKVMRKHIIIEKNHADYMKAERDILTKIVHPFIVQLQYSFQTKTKLYLILDFINGGHLFFQLYQQGMFSEDLARFYAAEIISAVAHLHKHGIVHRDLKPENILLDAEGHVKLTDFGLAKEINDSKPSNSMCGTVEYMAPEIVLAKGHGKAVDWWSLGILLYEMLTGQPPFTHNNPQKLGQKIVKDKIKLPPYLTSEAHSLLRELLQKDPNKRLGSGITGSDDIKKHKWFKCINWRRLDARGINPPFKPKVDGRTCIANFDKEWTRMPAQDSPAATPKSCLFDHFQGYTYIAPNPWLSSGNEDSLQQ